MRKPKVGHDELMLGLFEHQQEIEQSLHHSSAAIWKTISSQFSGKITPKAVYTFVKTNRRNCLETLKIEEPLKQRKSDVSEDSDSSSDNGSLGYGLKLDLSLWAKIIPKVGERYLQNGWTHVINDLLMKNGDLNECIWKFKYGYFVSDCNAPYLKMNGSCKECFGTVVVRDFKVLDGEVLLTFEVSNIDKGKHNGKHKRHLTGERRREMGKALASEPPVNFQRNTAVELIKTDPKLRTLPNLDSLRKCKEEFMNYENQNLATASSSRQGPIEKLHILQFTFPYQTAIHHLSVCKFDIKYWSREQLVTYNAYIKECKNIPSKLAVDATGCVVKKIPRPHNSHSGNIFLYSAVIHTSSKHGQIPVTQMLSESHNTDSIAMWLLLWKRQGALVPKVVVCDHSWALLGALCWAFNLMYLKAYMSNMFSILISTHNPNLRCKGVVPACFIRVDYAHVIKIVSHWESMRKKPRRFREFYLHSMSILIKCTRLSESEKLIKALFVLANSEFIGNDANGDQTPAQMSKNILSDLIAQIHPIDLDELEGKEREVSQKPVDEIDEDGDNAEHDDAIKSWIENMLEHSRIQAQAVTNEDNFHYCPDFAKDLARFLKSFLLWSAVLVPVFNYGNHTETSTHVESYFNDLKNRSFANKQLPLRVDKFFVAHYRAIQGMMIMCSHEKQKEAKTELGNEITIKEQPVEDKSEKLYEPEGRIIMSSHKKQKNTKTELGSSVITREQPQECESEEWSEEDWIENWRGQGVCPKRRRTGYYGVPCPEVLTLEAEKKIKISLLKNLNQIRTPIAFNKEKYIIDNSCPFDSVIQALAVGYCDSLEMRRLVDEDGDNIIFKLVKSLLKDGTKPITLKMRIEILIKCGKFECKRFEPISAPGKNQTKHMLKMDCACNVSYILTSFIDELHSGIESMSCQSCGMKRQRQIPFITLDCDERKDFFASMQKSIIKNKSFFCKTCSVENNVQCTARPFLFIDCDHGYIALNELSLQVKYNDRNYVLRAVIHFEQPSASTVIAIGHYVTYGKRLDGLWELFDDCSREFTTVSSNYRINPHLILYSF
ncbi:hypothetical protein RI129_000751 [Pyrocoelia pectoralis]|uniref:USP domain-containing protein n=1 Tax=Pyrocoelia pectoralis TaxID=417401 RepID=A0AAN7VJL7_9COLE